MFMKKLILSVIALILFTIIANAQDKIKGSKIVTIVETEIDDFHTLELGEDFEVQLTQAEIPSVEIETDDNLHDVIEFNVSRGVLSFRTNAKIRSKKRLSITIRYNNFLENIEAFDNADISTLSTIKADSLFNITVRDKARTNIDIDAKTLNIDMKNKSGLKLNARSKMNITSDVLDVKMSNSSRLEAVVTCDSLNLYMTDRSFFTTDGKTEKLEAQITGSGNFDGKGFTSVNCNAILKEDSDLAIQVNDDFILNSSGNSEAELYGNSKITIERFADKSKLSKKEL